ncbi:UNVERIFIED_CONTAM: hypothetical protein FKN15_074915 [Acipenser sinensis]
MNSFYFYLFSQKMVTALDKNWHPEHFCCVKCGRPFGEEGFHERDGRQYCQQDFFSMFASRCHGCSKPIQENYISALNVLWHPECFVCRFMERKSQLEELETSLKAEQERLEKEGRKHRQMEDELGRVREEYERRVKQTSIEWVAVLGEFGV